MEKMRMVGIVIFMVMTIISAGYAFYLTSKDKKATLVSVWGLSFLFTTFVLLFSDKTGEFAANILGNKCSAKFQQIDSTVTIIKSDQRQLTQTVDKILKIIDLEKSKPKLMILPGEDFPKKEKEYNDSIKMQKKELNNILTQPKGAVK
jgi:hypothetical protein